MVKFESIIFEKIRDGYSAYMELVTDISIRPVKGFLIFFAWLVMVLVPLIWVLTFWWNIWFPIGILIICVLIELFTYLAKFYEES